MSNKWEIKTARRGALGQKLTSEYKAMFVRLSSELGALLARERPDLELEANPLSAIGDRWVFQLFLKKNGRTLKVAYLGPGAEPGTVNIEVDNEKFGVSARPQDILSVMESNPHPREQEFREEEWDGTVEEDPRDVLKRKLRDPKTKVKNYQDLQRERDMEIKTNMQVEQLKKKNRN